MDDYSQDQSFTIKGYWWLPESEIRVAGDLFYSEDDITLSLYGGLSEATIDEYM